MPKLDDIDRRILAVLQDNGAETVAEIAERAGISQTPCWKRIKRLEENGIIEKRVALLAPEKLNLSLIGFIQIRTSNHSEAWLKEFNAGIQKIPEIVECHRLAGETDYLLKIVAPDMAGYDAIYKRLIKIVEMTDVSGSFSMEQLKQTTQLPLDYIAD